MNYFNASAHADKIRGTDGTGRFTTQQSAENTLSLVQLDSKWDLSDHDEFYDEDGRLTKLVRYKGLKPDDGADGAPAVILFPGNGLRIEKRYREGVLHDGSGAHGSIETYRADGSVLMIQRGFYTAGLTRNFRNQNSPDGQPGNYRVLTDGSRSITHYTNGIRANPQPGVPAHTVIAPDGTHKEFYFDAKGRNHERNPGEPAGFVYYADGSLSGHAYYHQGKAVNGPRGVQAESFHPDGHTKSIHYVYYEDSRYGNPYVPNYSTAEYSVPRPVDEIIESPLTMAEVVDRVDEHGQLTVRVRVPLAKQRGSLLAATGIFDLDEVSAVKVDTPRNRTVFDVTCDATKIISTWEGSDEDKKFVSKYWRTVLKEKREARS